MQPPQSYILGATTSRWVSYEARGMEVANGENRRTAEPPSKPGGS
jgi:hypothetical protein